MIKPGDIIAYSPKSSSKIFSKIIAFVSRFTVGNKLKLGDISISHVSIASNVVGMQYESKWPKSTHSKISPKKLKTYNVYILSINDLDRNDRSKIIKYCQSNLNKYYDLIALITFGLINPKKYLVCSEFAADAYKSAGIDLRMPKEKLISPNEVFYNEKFTKIKY